MLNDAALDIEGTIRSFPRYTGEPVPGYVIDFLGTRTRAEFVRGLQGGTVEDYPLPANFHATALEWAGTLAAVREATDQLCALELGAGWAPWLVSVARAATLRGIARLRLIGVEGSKQHCEYMTAHFRDNGLDPQAHTLLHGVVGPQDGAAEFPVLSDPSVDWGTAAILPASTGVATGVRRTLRPLRALIGRRPAATPATESLLCYSIPTLLANCPQVDLVHIDIQGHEYAVISAAREALQQKAKRLVIGTHGRLIEEQLLNAMSADGWLLEAEESCRYRQSGERMILERDGCQVWKNLALATAAGSHSRAA